jgi:hypothetical protein
VASLESVKPAEAGTSNRLCRMHAQLGIRRKCSATTVRPFVQAHSARDDSFATLGNVAARIFARLQRARR